MEPKTVKPRILYLLAAALCFLALAGCGQVSNPGAIPAENPAAPVPIQEAAPAEAAAQAGTAPDSQAEPQLEQQAEAESLPAPSLPAYFSAQMKPEAVDAGTVTRLLAQDDAIWLLGSQAYAFSDTATPALWRFSNQGTTAERIDLDLPLDACALDMAADGQSLWLACCQWDLHGACHVWLSQRDGTGQELTRHDLPEAECEALSGLNAMAATEEELFLLTSGALYRWQRGTGLLEQIPGGDRTRSLTTDAQGRVLALTQDDETLQLVPLRDERLDSQPLAVFEPQSQDQTTPEGALPQSLINAMGIAPDRTGAVICTPEGMFTWDEGGLYLLAETGASRLLGWTDLGLGRGPVLGCWFSGAFWFTWADAAGQLRLVTVTGGGAPVEKQVLTTAVVSAAHLNSFKSLVETFNLTSPDYFIQIIDYTGYEDPLAQLSLDLADGSIPDLYVTEGLPFLQWARQGRFLDLDLFDGCIRPTTCPIRLLRRGAFPHGGFRRSASDCAGSSTGFHVGQSFRV